MLHNWVVWSATGIRKTPHLTSRDHMQLRWLLWEMKAAELEITTGMWLWNDTWHTATNIHKSADQFLANEQELFIANFTWKWNPPLKSNQLSLLSVSGQCKMMQLDGRCHNNFKLCCNVPWQTADIDLQMIDVEVRKSTTTHDKTSFNNNKLIIWCLPHDQMVMPSMPFLDWLLGEQNDKDSNKKKEFKMKNTSKRGLSTTFIEKFSLGALW